MIIETVDVTTWITKQEKIDGEMYIEYENGDGRRWFVRGNCNACGLCEDHDDVYLGKVVTKINHTLMDDNKIVKWSRTLKWLKEPGQPGAVEEENYHIRRDIPITPDMVNNCNCTLKSDWIK